MLKISKEFNSLKLRRISSPLIELHKKILAKSTKKLAVFSNYSDERENSKELCH